jgi:hypothetical protein
MKQIYKAGGVRKTKSGVEYTIRAASDADRVILLGKGWVSSIEELKVKTEEVKSPFDLKSSETEKPVVETKKKTKAK